VKALKRYGKKKSSLLASRRARLAVLLLVAWPPAAWAAARWLVVSAELQHADALAVLAGSSTYVERARRAAELFREGRASRVVLTNDGQRGGWSAAEERNPFFVERSADELRRAGVPGESVEVIPQTVSSTYDEAVSLRDYAVAHGLRSVLVVTSGYQSRRALWTLHRVFAGSGIEVGVAPVEPGQQAPPASVWWLHTLGWRLVPGEYAKLVYYRLHY
jgi:uncharacterized SAM-binding protein YcdF (DUF218 family)